VRTAAVQSRDVELMHWGRLARHRWPVLVLVTVLCLGVAFWVLARDHPRYEATATVSLASALDPSAAAARDPATEDELAIAESEELLAATRAALGGPLDLAVSATPSSRLLVFRAGSDTAARAAAGAQAHADAYVLLKRDRVQQRYDSAVASLQQALDGVDADLARASGGEQQAVLAPLRQTYVEALQQMQIRRQLAVSEGPQVVSPANPPGSAEPVPALGFAAVALLIGLVLGLLAAALIDYFDDRLRDPADLQDPAGSTTQPGQPHVAVVPRLRQRDLGSATSRRPRVRLLASRARSDQVVLAPVGTPAADWWSRTRVALERLGSARACTVLQVTSAAHDDGAAEAALNLAAAFARGGREVVLVCLDVRDPDRLAAAVEPDGSPVLNPGDTPFGAFDGVLGHVALSDVALSASGQCRLSVVLAGSHPAPVDALSRPAAGAFFASLRASADLVLVLAPPVLPYPEATLLAGLVDGTVLVAELGSSRRRDLRQAAQALTAGGSGVQGIVLVGGRRVASRTGSYGQVPRGDHGRHASTVVPLNAASLRD
jgi:succinoglycan biosynthesis transport protein ExoP